MSEQENGAVKVLKDILHAQKVMARATVVLFLLLGLFGGIAWTVRLGDVQHINQIASQNQTALCAFRQDVAQRITNTEEILQEHPNGIPGVSASALRISLTTQRQTFDALSILNCGT